MRTFIILALMVAAWDIVPSDGFMISASNFFKGVMAILLFISIIMAIAQDIKELLK